MRILTLLAVLFAIQSAAAQNSSSKFYAYWGWNRAGYSLSNISFSGDNYQFKLYDVLASDRQSKFDVKIYFNPKIFTLPQYNFRVGYFFKQHYDVSLGADHMKYVVVPDQIVKITGSIKATGTRYDSVYSGENIALLNDFLRFEHTDGLNYLNAEIRRSDVVWAWQGLSFLCQEGLGAGLLVPRTNVTLLNKQNHDEFHLSGYGLNAVVTTRLHIFHFFVQSELKGGFIHMPDIRTSYSTTDKAAQHFFFYQKNIVVGLNWRFSKKKI